MNKQNNTTDYMKMSIDPIIESGINRRSDVMIIIIFLCLIFVPAIIFWVMPDKKSSEEENRALQQMPAFSADNFISGKFTGSMAKYYADQFPLRNAFINAKTIFSYAFLINENKGTVIAKDGYLIQRYDKYSEKSIAEKSSSELGGDLTFSENMKNIKNNCGYVNTFAENIKNMYPEKNITVTFAVPPRKIDVMTNKLPMFFPIERHEKYFEELYKYIDNDIYFDLLNALKPKNDEYIYYKTDHHWTTLGAFYAYSSISETMGYEALSKEDYTIETVSEDFYGVLYSKAGAKWIEPDTIEYYKSESTSYFATKIHGANNKTTTLQEFYDREKLETKDKYSSFLGGINSRITLSNMILSRYNTKLLLIADSFGQSLAPFLACNYDYIEVIDTRFFNDNIYDFIENLEPDNILILVNMENLSTQDNLKKLTQK